MKKIFAVACLCIYYFISFSQPIPRQSIEDSVIGWNKVYNFKGVKEGIKVDNKIYSANQISLCDSFANWMQASYIPKGGLGDLKKTVSQKLGLYNQNDAALPQAYGVHAVTYTDLKYNSAGKMQLVSIRGDHWSIMANAPIGIPADALGTPSQYYFTLPSFKEQGYGEELPKLYELTTHPNTKSYFTYFRRNSAIGNEKTILLFKDNKSPFIKIAKGEYLQVIEEAITRLYEKEKKNIYEKEKNSHRSIDYFMKYLNEKNEKRIATLKINKEKYKHRLDETAEIFTSQPDVMLENYPDVFEGNGGSSIKLPVYKLDPLMVELCKKDKPQWIRVTWHGDINHPVGKHQHQSIINNFNFEYIYNFFFNPEKVKGQLYKPLRSPTFKEAVVITQASEKSKKITADATVFFFDDFSTTSISKKPIGWQATLTREGTTAVVTKPDGLEGNWVEIRGHYINATLIKKPLPQNFSLSYDLVASQNFTWGAKGLTMQLSKETSPGNAESFLNLSLRPGFDGRDGEAVLETKFPFPPGYSNATKWYVATGFSNNKKNNRITVK